MWNYKGKRRVPDPCGLSKVACGWVVLALRMQFSRSLGSYILDQWQPLLSCVFIVAVLLYKELRLDLECQRMCTSQRGCSSGLGPGRA
jgi:hypothetical protein